MLGEHAGSWNSSGPWPGDRLPRSRVIIVKVSCIATPCKPAERRAVPGVQPLQHLNARYDRDAAGERRGTTASETGLVAVSVCEFTVKTP